MQIKPLQVRRNAMQLRTDGQWQETRLLPAPAPQEEQVDLPESPLQLTLTFE